MNARAVTTPALLALLCGLALAVPAEACPMQQQNAESSSPVVLAGDMETKAVEENLRPDEVAEQPDAEAKGSGHEGHSQHQNAEDVEDEAIQEDLETGDAPAAE